MQIGQRIAAIGMAVSGALALVKIFAGLAGNSTAVLADGMESAADVFSSGFVLLGLTLAAKPPDEDHPYGHGRIETLAGLMIGLLLTAGGALISYGSAERLGHPHEPIATYVVWVMVASLVSKTILALYKYRVGKKIGSSALNADAWNDAMDSLSAVTALVAVGLALLDPARFLDADRYGGIVVGLIVVYTGGRIARETALQLMDTMPDDKLMHQIRTVAAEVEGARAVEKCFARKTGLRYHVDLHLEVDPEMTVRRSHDIAHQVRLRILERLDWVADVLVHVEPAP
jgi:cation diffusion facilitator family transporter